MTRIQEEEDQEHIAYSLYGHSMTKRPLCSLQAYIFSFTISLTADKKPMHIVHFTKQDTKYLTLLKHQSVSCINIILKPQYIFCNCMSQRESSDKWPCCPTCPRDSVTTTYCAHGTGGHSCQCALVQQLTIQYNIKFIQPHSSKK